eukprot:tig00000254_g22505.t1
MFDGGAQRRRDVSLRGASAKQSREEVLAKARQEREARSSSRAQERAATLLQVAWRRARVLSGERATERRAFDAEAAAGALESGERLALLVRRLLFFVRAAEDDARLARVLQALASGLATGVGAAYLSLAAAPAGRLTLVHQLRGLSSLALASLRRAVASGAAPPALPLQFLLSYSQTAGWPLKPEQLSGILVPSLTRLVDEGLYGTLRRVLTGPGAASSALQAATLALLPLRALPSDGSGAPSGPKRAGPLRELRAAERAHALLAAELWTLPDLFGRLPEVTAAMFRRPALWRALVPALAAALTAASTSAGGAAAWLPDGPWGAAALLANLLEGSEAALPSAPAECLVSYVSVLGSLLGQAAPAALPAPPRPAPGEEDGDGVIDVDSDSEMTDAEQEEAGPGRALAARIARAASPGHLRALLSPPLLPAAPQGKPIGLPPPLASVASAAGGSALPAAAPDAAAAGAPGYRPSRPSSRPCSAAAPPSPPPPSTPSPCARTPLSFAPHPTPTRLHALATGTCYLPSAPPGAAAGAASVLGLLCRLLVHAFDGSDDAELLEAGKPFSPPELAALAPLLKQAALRALLPAGAGGGAAPGGPNAPTPPCAASPSPPSGASTRASPRRGSYPPRPGSPPSSRLSSSSPTPPCAPPLTPCASEERGRRARGILREVPFMVPFESRVRILQALIAADKDTVRGASWEGLRPRTVVPIRRDFLFEDAFAGLNHLRGELRQALRVQFISELGLEEAGVDGGGLFKEFMTSLAKTAFDSQYALFKATPDRLLYPNPSSHLVSGEHLRQFEFLGRMLGKAIYEGVLLDLPFARFFLSKILGKHNYVNDLPSLDPDLHKNLMFLKRLESGVEELGLNFAVVDNEFGEAREVPLIPGGEKEAVTDENRIRYVHLVAHYRLNVQIARQCAAFLRGLQDLIRPEWLAMFSEEELQVVIAGSQEAFDTEDLRRHTAYSGGYTEESPTIQAFWEVVAGFGPEQRRALLKFVTSSTRGPLLGFRYLVPSFCIHRGDPDTERLPSASTCMNLLKLPPYPTAAALREKLTYAISSNAGFELS